MMGETINRHERRRRAAMAERHYRVQRAIGDLAIRGTLDGSERPTVDHGGLREVCRRHGLRWGVAMGMALDVRGPR